MRGGGDILRARARSTNLKYMRSRQSSLIPKLIARNIYNRNIYKIYIYISATWKKLYFFFAALLGFMASQFSACANIIPGRDRLYFVCVLSS